MAAYDIRPIKAPRLTGGMLRLATFLVENPVTGDLVAAKVHRDVGIDKMRRTPVDCALPAAHELLSGPRLSDGPGGAPALPRDLAPSRAPEGFRFESAADFATAYREGRSTPIEVAERIVEVTRLTENADPPLRLFVAQDAADLMEQARESARRWRDGQPLGPLDGVPVAIKDELDQRGYPTTVGTRFLGARPAASDAEVVRRLRQAGALLPGKLNMHELGIGVTGINPHHGTCRNPYDPRRMTGGSSSGSGAAVAAGLCPIAVGADGGGSIRHPASLCGVVGLKATFGRISERGAAPLCWSVAHVGPLAATARDAALAYAVMAGPDPEDPNTRAQPAPHLSGFGDMDLGGLRLGVFRPWFEDAAPDVVGACWQLVRGLEAHGAELQDVVVHELALLRTVHLVTIVSEMAASQLVHTRHRSEYAPETRFNLALGRRLRAQDYVHAQRHRQRLQAQLARLFEAVDVLVTPTTAITAPLVPEDALRTGESNLEVLDRIMRFTLPANLTGLPAISVPAGYDDAGLPIGLQLMGRAWEEHVLLRLAHVAESLVVRARPRVHHALLFPRPS